MSSENLAISENLTYIDKYKAENDETESVKLEKEHKILEQQIAEQRATERARHCISNDSGARASSRKQKESTS